MPTLRQLVDQPDLAVLFAGGPGYGRHPENGSSKRSHEVLQDKGWQKVKSWEDGGIYKHSAHPGLKVGVDERDDSWKVANGSTQHEGRGGAALREHLTQKLAACGRES